MPQMEFEGKNLQNAIEKACKKLNYSKDKLKYDILSSGSSGIFGLIGAKKAKIRVLELPEEMASTKSGGNGQSKSEGIKSLVDEAFSDFQPVKEREANKKVSTSTIEKEKTALGNIEVDEIDSDESFDIDEEALDAIPVELYKYPEEPVNSGKDYLTKIVNYITDDASIEITADTDRVVYHIAGGNPALLIGKRGQTLDAIQYIIDKIVNKQSENRIRIQIDVEGYNETRKESLKQLAIKLAEKAKKSGKPTTISQMTSHDRRIVHLTLKDDHTVKTRSVGEGYYRRLIIFPKKKSGRKGGRSGKPRN